MAVFFFDIDGTLLLTGGAGRLAMQAAFAELFGERALPKLLVHGRTDSAIIAELFSRLEMQPEASALQQFVARYHELLEEGMKRAAGQLLPGVAELLLGLSRRRAVLGLLTGNSEHAARTKLAFHRIDHYFCFGGYGDVHHERECVAAEALASCRAWALPRTIAAEEVWVVGDTIHDVRCARSIGANVIAVTTGGSSRRELETAGADMVLDDLRDPGPLLALCQASADRE
jgi:phosphoglycolate phosphatase-like HAD superfamily hydrolase